MGLGVGNWHTWGSAVVQSRVCAELTQLLVVVVVGSGVSERLALAVVHKAGVCWRVMGRPTHSCGLWGSSLATHCTSRRLGVVTSHTGGDDWSTVRAWREHANKEQAIDRHHHSDTLTGRIGSLHVGPEAKPHRQSCFFFHSTLCLHLGLSFAITHCLVLHTRLFIWVAHDSLAQHANSQPNDHLPTKWPAAQ